MPGGGNMLFERDPQPFLRIDTRSRQLTFNRVVHDLLGKPPYFMFYWRKDINALYVAAQQEEILHSYAIPPSVLKNPRLEILCQRAYLFEDLHKRMRWIPGQLYKTYGSFDKTTGTVCFPLEKSHPMEVIPS